MCGYCAIGSPQASQGHPRVLQLLELIEHPNALPADAALRIAGDLLAWVGEVRPRFQCEAVLTHATQTDTLA
jgi:hypothetical protein